MEKKLPRVGCSRGFRSDLAAIQEATALTRAFLETFLGITEEEESDGLGLIFRIGLSVDELITNAIKHGNQYQPDRRVNFALSLRSRAVVVKVDDFGAGFDPSQVPDPCTPKGQKKSSGRGLFLTERLGGRIKTRRTKNFFRVTVVFLVD
ncbi:MAG: hypothetical protein COV31_01355 [Candidatus Yanofskybacteria bacterium CG10_big_fil_rev_8_21_14_0_10_46_23]|uniref:Histidine kinase/HSP90-like ATPase domain-containing protein n=1 Tax=Candidatus Yanofskybacteria bacterium CG10_big_fil_rev_8_21_14_0_10_46_23 TaxID=1975098 RepID=A0A2H0R4U8_9BACT|nr:MAG: hypothetical protein COV31_01355 [Candidatus Yanofskybacteria bacterium CG10_big_fil_rev_8_21_14_0_10_46_23]